MGVCGHTDLPAGLAAGRWSAPTRCWLAIEALRCSRPCRLTAQAAAQRPPTARRVRRLSDGDGRRQFPADTVRTRFPRQVPRTKSPCVARLSHLPPSTLVIAHGVNVVSGSAWESHWPVFAVTLARVDINSTFTMECTFLKQMTLVFSFWCTMLFTYFTTNFKAAETRRQTSEMLPVITVAGIVDLDG